EFYLLGNAHKRGALHVDPVEEIEDEFALVRGEILPEKPIRFRYHSGSKPYDLIGTTYAPLYLVSDCVIHVFEQEGFTGWLTYPVEVYGKKGERLEGYHGFAVSGRCGPIDNTLSRREWRPAPPGGNPYLAWIGLYFDLSSWDGSDIFVPVSSGYIIVVERVKEALERVGITNVMFDRLTEIERLVL
ncbi:MAG: hypothetical protein D6732_24330, partial [Methanobacteriota archaeon]